MGWAPIFALAPRLNPPSHQSRLMKTRHVISLPSETLRSKPRRRHLEAVLCLLAAALWFSPTTAHAQSGTWAGDASGNWGDTTKWSGGTVADGAGNTATFNLNITANRTVTLDSSRTIGTVLFGDTSQNQLWTLSTANSSVLTMDNGANKPLIRAVQGGTGFRCNVVIAGANGFRGPDTASGVLALGSANTYTGDTEIDRNIVKISNVNALPSMTVNGRSGDVVFIVPNTRTEQGTLDLNGNSITINGLAGDTTQTIAGLGTVTTTAAGTLTLTLGDNNRTTTFAGVIQNGSGTLGLTKIGTGAQTLTGVNTYTRATTISGGTLALSGSGSIATSASVTVGPGATFDVSGVSAPPYVIAAGKTLIGPGATGTIAGSLSLDPSASLAITYVSGTPTMNVSSGGTLTLNGGAITVTVSGSPLGNGNYKLISVSGSGAVAGTLGSVTVAGSGIIGGGTASLSISGGNELYLNITGGATALEWGSGDGTWAVGTTGWNSGGSTAWANGNVALFADALSSGNPTITLNTEVLPQGAVVTSTRNYTITGTGHIGGAAEVRKLGTSTLTLDVPNAHTGGSTLLAGTLNIKKSAALGAASSTLTIGGGTLDNTSGGPLTTPDYPQAWNGNFTFAGSSDLNLGAGAVAMSGTRTVTVTANTLTVGGAISGAGFGLIKAGTGKLALGGNNTFTGGVTITNGEIIVNNAGALGVNALTMPDDTSTKILSLNGNTLTVANLSLPGFTSPATAIIRNNHASTAAQLMVSIPSSSGAFTFCGTITDGGAAPLAVRKIGAGTWQMGTAGTGFFDYSGDTSINAGVLRGGKQNFLPFGAGKGNLIVESAGTLDIYDRANVSVNGLSGSGIVDKTDPGGAINAVLTVGYNDASAEFSGAIKNTGVPASSKYSGVSLVKTGAGTQILSGVNLYTNTTTVSGGTLLVNSPGSLAAQSVVTVNAGATLGGNGTVNGPVTVNAGGTVSAGDSPGTLTLGNGLDLSAGGTNAWELASLKDDTDGTPGTDFDQIVLAGGALTLGGSSTLSIRFTGTATAPDGSNPFWQSTRNWTVVSASGAATTFAAIQNGVYPAGTFTTAAQAGGIVLTFTPNAGATPVTSFTITNGPGSNLTLSYSGGSGSRFVLLQTNNVAAPLSLWARVHTNTSSPNTFTITPGADPMEFYRVKSE